jgi:Na+-transporting methylmalonyl-CoA/oxaloacetate decarboxylase gamma subunit
LLGLRLPHICFFSVQEKIGEVADDFVGESRKKRKNKRRAERTPEEKEQAKIIEAKAAAREEQVNDVRAYPSSLVQCEGC